MYHLTVTSGGKLVRSVGPLGAPEALKAWFDEETTGYHVQCRDQANQAVTKAGLREIARHAQRA